MFEWSWYLQVSLFIIVDGSLYCNANAHVLSVIPLLHWPIKPINIHHLQAFVFNWKEFIQHSFPGQMICSGQGCLSAPAPISYNGNMTPFFCGKTHLYPFSWSILWRMSRVNNAKALINLKGMYFINFSCLQTTRNPINQICVCVSFPNKPMHHLLTCTLFSVLPTPDLFLTTVGSKFETWINKVITLFGRICFFLSVRSPIRVAMRE